MSRPVAHERADGKVTVCTEDAAELLGEVIDQLLEHVGDRWCTQIYSLTGTEEACYFFVLDAEVHVVEEARQVNGPSSPATVELVGSYKFPDARSARAAARSMWVAYETDNQFSPNRGVLDLSALTVPVAEDDPGFAEALCAMYATRWVEMHSHKMVLTPGDWLVICDARTLYMADNSDEEYQAILVGSGFTSTEVSFVRNGRPVLYLVAVDEASVAAICQYSSVFIALGSASDPSAVMLGELTVKLMENSQIVSEHLSAAVALRCARAALS